MRPNVAIISEYREKLKVIIRTTKNENLLQINCTRRVVLQKQLFVFVFYFFVTN